VTGTRIASLLVGVAVLAGCGSSSKSSAGGRCEDVPLSLNNEVASSLATGYSVDGFEAVQSNDSKVWFVSARAVDPKGGVIYPVWVTEDLNGGPIMIGDLASFNVTPDAKKFKGFSDKTDGVSESQDCARKANTGGSS
jgi:hypothetical protein